jgi:hypothetical protein
MSRAKAKESSDAKATSGFASDTLADPNAAPVDYVIKSKKEAKKLFSKLDRRAVKKLNELDVVQGLGERLAELEVSEEQLRALWRTFEKDKNDEVDTKSFLLRLCPKPAPKEEKKGKGKPVDPAAEAKAAEWEKWKKDARYCKLQDLEKVKKLPRKKFTKFSMEHFQGIFLEMFDGSKQGAKEYFRRAVEYVQLSKNSNGDFDDAKYYLVPVPNQPLSAEQPSAASSTAQSAEGETSPPHDGKQEQPAERKREKLGSLSKKHFFKVLDRLMLENRRRCNEEHIPIAVWSSGRLGLREIDIEETWAELDQPETGRMDLERWLTWLIPEKFVEAGGSAGGKKGKGKAASKAKKSKGKEKENAEEQEEGKEVVLVNPLKYKSKHRDIKRKTHGPEYKFVSVKEAKLQDFASNLLLNNIRTSQQKEIYCEPPLQHFDEVELNEKGVQGSGYSELLFLTNQTRVRAVVWPDECVGPEIFATYVSMLSARSTSRWLYHAKLCFDRNEKLIRVEHRSIRTFIDGYLYDVDQIEDFEDWATHVNQAEGDHDYHLIRDVPS